MLKNIDLTREVPKAEYKRLKADADLKLAALQRQSKALSIPIIVVFEGWSAAGKQESSEASLMSSCRKSLEREYRPFYVQVHYPP